MTDNIHTENDQTVTVTRDNPDALLELIKSLNEGQMVTAEWRDGDRSMTITGPVSRDIYGGARVPDLWMDLWSLNIFGIAAGGAPHASLHSITATREVTKRWERESDD